MPPRSAWITALVLACCLALVPSASAGDPPTARQPIVSADFNADDGGFVLSEIVTERQAAAGWGRVANAEARRGTSGHGLWCAGTRFYPAPAGPSTYFPNYPGAYNYLLQASREPVVLPLVTAKPLKYADASSIEVWSAQSGGYKYDDDTDYVVGVNLQGQTTIARRTGTTIPNGATVYVTYKWPSAGTRGSATLDLPQLAEYYRSWVSFYYVMPSVGTGDLFSFHWKETGTTGANESYSYPLAATWKSEQREISNGNSVSLSRTPATLWFQFFDMSPGATGTQYGRGPAIDDFAVTGIKYGPVDPSTIATAAGGEAPVAVADYQSSYVGTATVELSGVDSGQLKLVWGPPRLTPTDASPDTRDVSYRVWRKSGAGAWTELTSEADRAGMRELPEAAAPGVYTYAVQAWDPVGQGSAYGEVAQKQLSIGAASAGNPIEEIEYSLDAETTQAVPAQTHDVVVGPRAAPYTLRFRVRDEDNNWSPARTIVFSVNAATSFSALSGNQQPSYGNGATISGKLMSGAAPVPGNKTVKLQRLSGRTSGTWIDVASKPTDATGYVKFDVPASSSGYDYTKTYYRLSFAGVAGYAPKDGDMRYIDPKAYLGTPWSSKSTVYRKKSYTWYASLKPRHTGKPVKLYFERYSRGKYRPYKTVYASAYNYSTYSRVKAKYTIPYAGKWRVRAYHDDSGHAPSYSKWLYKRVR